MRIRWIPGLSAALVVLGASTAVGAQEPAPQARPEEKLDRIEDRIEQLLRRLEPLSGEGMRRPPQGGAGVFQSQGSSMRVEQGPDGAVKVTVTETVNGSAETKEYTAESWEDFREKYPEVADRFRLESGGGGFSLRFGPGPSSPFGLLAPGGRSRLRLEPLWKDLNLAPWNPTPGLAPSDENGERLGIFVAPPPPGLVEYLGFEEGVGLIVEQVEAGSLAEKMGLRRDDLLLRIEGRDVRGAETVREALESVPAGETIEVEIARRGRGVMNLSATKEAPAQKMFEGTRKT